VVLASDELFELTEQAEETELDADVYIAPELLLEEKDLSVDRDIDSQRLELVEHVVEREKLRVAQL